MFSLIFLALLVAYIFVRDMRVRVSLSGILTGLSLLTFIAFGGIFNLVILGLWGYLFYRDLGYAGIFRR